MSASLPRFDNPLIEPMVSVVVVNYNGCEGLLRCLKSLFIDGYPHKEILVVDNASTDGSRAMLENLMASSDCQVNLLWSDRNLGYAGAVNLAMRSAAGCYLAILNMDVEVDAGWLEPLVAFLDAHPNVAAVNPLIALASHESINAAGQDIHITGLGFNKGLGRPLAEAGRNAFPISGIQGGAFVVRRSILELTGGMDARGFLYHEDVNLSWLLRLMGLELYCVPESLVRHDYFLSMYPAKLQLLERNRWAMLLAYLRWPAVVLLLPALILTEVLMWGYCILRGPAFGAAKLRSYKWVFSEWSHIRSRRHLAERLRAVSDWKVLSNLKWGYAWDQFRVLGKERGRSRRQPAELPM